MNRPCEGCGELHDYPWGFCLDCTGCLIDLSREPIHRLNSPEVLGKQVLKMTLYKRKMALKELTQLAEEFPGGYR